MINLIRDILNLNNWKILINNPSNAKKKLITRFFSYPSKRVGRIKNKFIRNLSVDFWIYLAKKNNNFKKIFFEKTNYNINIKIEHVFDYKNNYETLSKGTTESLRSNGVAILKNILPEKEHFYTKNKFNELININSQDKNWMTPPKVITKNDGVKLTWAQDNLDNYNTLKKINYDLTKLIYGKPLETNAEYFFHESKKLPEEIIKGDNHLYMDRFIPNLKLYYSPFKIDEDSASFQYIMGSHKINKNYIDYWKTSENWDEYEDFKNKNIYLERMKSNNNNLLEIEENCLIAALTNGLHGRKVFLKHKDRKVIFLTYNSYNKISLLNPKKFN